jgi:hypothetical protein
MAKPKHKCFYLQMLLQIWTKNTMILACMAPYAIGMIIAIVGELAPVLSFVKYKVLFSLKTAIYPVAASLAITQTAIALIMQVACIRVLYKSRIKHVLLFDRK